MAFDSYKINRRLDAVNSKLKNAEILPENREAINGVIAVERIRGSGAHNLIKMTHYATELGLLAKKPFKEMTKTDVQELLSKYVGGNYSPTTERIVVIVTKMLFRAAYNLEDGENPPVTRWLKPRRFRNQLNPSDLISREELNRLIQSAATPRNKAFISCLYESGCRISEMLGLAVKDVQQDANGYLLSVNGKTGKRRVRIIASTTLLSLYLGDHPRKNDGNAPLWYADTKGEKPLLYHATRWIIKTLFSIANVDLNKAKAHRFRHSRASETATFLTRPLQNALFGWSAISNTAATYEHLTDTAVDGALLAANKKATETRQEPTFIEHNCERCHIPNGPGFVYCRACGFKLGSNIGELMKNDAALDLLKMFMAANPNLQQTVATMPTDQLQAIDNSLHQIGGDLEFSYSGPGEIKRKTLVLQSKKKRRVIALP